MHAMPVCVLYKIFRALSFKLFYNVRHREFTPLHFSIECTTWVSTKMHHPGAPLRKDFLPRGGERVGRQMLWTSVQRVCLCFREPPRPQSSPSPDSHLQRLSRHQINIWPIQFNANNPSLNLCHGGRLTLWNTQPSPCPFLSWVITQMNTLHPKILVSASGKLNLRHYYQR